ncbi:hypothetical protein Agub_g14211, partial [Astrephomene gubernaculifera]
PYDEVTFSETISRSLRQVLQLGRALVEGPRGAPRSPDRVFGLLHMHRCLMELLPYLSDLLSPRERCSGLLNEAHLLGLVIGRAARQIYTEFEESVAGRGGGGGLGAAAAAAGGGFGAASAAGGGGGSGGDAVSKLTMLDGTVHPICATTLGFLKRLFTYPNALPLLFGPPGPGSIAGAAAGIAGAAAGGGGAGAGGGSASSSTSDAATAAAASSSIMRIMMRLLEVLESKARSYKAPALGHLFLMNNVHYMVWAVEQAAAGDKQQQQQQQGQQRAGQRRPRSASSSASQLADLPEEDEGEEDADEGDEDDEEEEEEDDDQEEEEPGTDKHRKRRDNRNRGNTGGTGGNSSGGCCSLGVGVLGVGWLERHKDIVEHYGAAYHEATWRPLLEGLEAVVVTQTDKEPSDPGRFKSWLKAKFAKLNSQLDAIFKQQSVWTIPDAKLKKAVRNVIKQDFLPLYGDFWERYTAVDFSTHPDKYLRYPPTQLRYLIDHTLFEGRAAQPPKGAAGASGGST